MPDLEMRMRYIKRIDSGQCGPQRQPLLYYRNMHPSWRIRIFVNHHWIYQGQELSEPQEYVLEPNPSGNPDLDVLMGCPFPNTTSQQFHWDIVDAKIE